MSVKVLFFGILADKTGFTTLNVENKGNLNELMTYLIDNFSYLKKKSYAVAVNQVIVRGNAILNDKDEIALLPPFAGG